MHVYGLTTSGVSDHSPGESTLVSNGRSPDTVHLNQDEGLQRDDFNNNDDLESELGGQEHFDKVKDEGSDGDLTEIAAPVPIDRTRNRGDSWEHEEGEARRRKSNTNKPDEGDEYLTELAAPAPILRHGTGSRREEGRRIQFTIHRLA